MKRGKVGILLKAIWGAFLLYALFSCGGGGSATTPAPAARSQKIIVPFSAGRGGLPSSSHRTAMTNPAENATDTTSSSLPPATLTQEGLLEGPPDWRVNEHLPSVPFPESFLWEFVDSRGRAFTETGRAHINVREFGLVLRDSTTLFQLSELLHLTDASILGASPKMKMLFVRLKQRRNLDEYLALLNRLEEDPRVERVIPQVTVYKASALVPTDEADWRWEVSPGGGNWNFEAVRVPQAWSLMGWIYRRQNLVTGGIVDEGFFLHPDLSMNHEELNGANPRLDNHHGTGVAGVWAALWGSTVQQRWLDGVLPNSILTLWGLTGRNVPPRGPGDPRWPPPCDIFGPQDDYGKQCLFWLQLLDDLFSQNKFLDLHPEISVLNLSIGYGCLFAGDAADPPGNPPDERARQIAEMLGRDFAHHFQSRADTLLLFQAAMNCYLRRLDEAEDDARWNSPSCYASIVGDPTSNPPVPPQQNIICVEATKNAAGYPLAGFSNVSGQLSAPGNSVTVLLGVDETAGTSGTSYASPLSAGAASLLKSFRPSLTVTQIRQALLTYSRSTPANQPEPRRAPMLDAFYALTGLDLMAGNTDVQRELVDADDGTVDGNLRMRVFTSDPNPDDVHAIPPGGTTPDHRRGDGYVTPRDFRTFRDVFLQVRSVEDANLAPLISLDGSATHFKRDLNMDGCLRARADACDPSTNPCVPANPPHPVDIPTPTNCSAETGAPVENVYPRYDFNGDGRITANAVNPASGDVAPFKIDPDTHCTGLNQPAGCLRDIDVMAQVWDASSCELPAGESAGCPSALYRECGQ